MGEALLAPEQAVLRYGAKARSTRPEHKTAKPGMILFSRRVLLPDAILTL